jgi:hypothetical protein
MNAGYCPFLNECRDFCCYECKWYYQLDKKDNYGFCDNDKSGHDKVYEWECCMIGCGLDEN